jgi:hypothetical protein
LSAGRNARGERFARVRARRIHGGALLWSGIALAFAGAAVLAALVPVLALVFAPPAVLAGVVAIAKRGPPAATIVAAAGLAIAVYGLVLAGFAAASGTDDSTTAVEQPPPPPHRPRRRAEETSRALRHLLRKPRARAGEVASPRWSP